MDTIKGAAKAFSVPIVTVILLGLNHFGVGSQMTVDQAVTILVGSFATSGVVYAVPNKQA